MSPVVQERSRQGFNLGDYVEVKERIRLFLEAHPEGRLVTVDVRLTREPDDKPRVMVEAAAYRTPDDTLPGRGWSWMELPGTTSYTRGSELENTETSAWGRAIAALGIGISKSIASKQEVDAKARDERAQRADTVSEEGLIGRAEIGNGDADFELRQVNPDSDGVTTPRIAFRLVQGRHKQKVEATGPLAELIAEHRPSIEGQLVTGWGALRDETFTPKGGREVTYQVLTLSRLKAGVLDLTEPDLEPETAPETADFDSGWIAVAEGAA